MTPSRTMLAALLLAAAGCATAGPQTVTPRHLNRDYFERAIEREYPKLLLQAGIGGVTEVLLRLDTEGIVQWVTIRESSGYPELDAAALVVARGMRFSPALNEGEPQEVQIAFTITFRAR